MGLQRYAFESVDDWVFDGTDEVCVTRHEMLPRDYGEYHLAADVDALLASIRAAVEANTNDNADPAPDPALLALARLGAAVVREMESPRYAYTFTWDESRVLDILAHEAGVRVHVSPADQVLAPGVADAIAALLAPDGAASEGVPG